ncbi:integrase core domain-containing protein [Vulcaniibacterium thermophilum]
MNEHWFTSLAQARNVIAEWRRDYNEVRPHSSCGRIPPPNSLPITAPKPTRPKYPSTRALPVTGGTATGAGQHVSLRKKSPRPLRGLPDITRSADSASPHLSCTA